MRLEDDNICWGDLSEMIHTKSTKAHQDHKDAK